MFFVCIFFALLTGVILYYEYKPIRKTHQFQSIKIDKYLRLSIINLVMVIINVVGLFSWLTFIVGPGV